MARLSTKARKALPASTFAGPGRSFPIPDKGHAKAALGLIGHAPPSARPRIRARAEAMLKGSPPGHMHQTHGPSLMTHSTHNPEREGENYTEHHELHHKAHPGEGFMGRESSKRHAAKSMKSGQFT